MTLVTPELCSSQDMMPTTVVPTLHNFAAPQHSVFHNTRCFKKMDIISKKNYFKLGPSF